MDLVREEQRRPHLELLLQRLQFAGVHVSAHVQPISEQGRGQRRRVLLLTANAQNVLSNVFTVAKKRNTGLISVPGCVCSLCLLQYLATYQSAIETHVGECHKSALQRG